MGHPVQIKRRVTHQSYKQKTYVFSIQGAAKSTP